MGDLVLTCTGGLSRNRTVGQRLGRGEKLEEILGSMRQVNCRKAPVVYQNTKASSYGCRNHSECFLGRRFSHNTHQLPPGQAELSYTLSWEIFIDAPIFL